ncbi:hypothetical protein KCV07_g3474, partial [Aureobasidium melanogenum]
MVTAGDARSTSLHHYKTVSLDLSNQLKPTWTTTILAGNGKSKKSKTLKTTSEPAAALVEFQLLDKTTMPTNKKTDAAAAAPTTTKGSAPMSIPAGSIASIWLATKAKITKDPTAGNIIKKANGQKLFIFEDEMVQHLMLLNA